MDNKMVIRADAKAMGAVTAHRTLASAQRFGSTRAVIVDGNWTHRKLPSRGTIALSEVISYNPRNGQTVDTGEVFKRTRNTAARRYRRSTSKADATRALLMSLPTIHEEV